MGIRIRTTEDRTHPMFRKLQDQFEIGEIQGCIFGCTDREMEEETRTGSQDIPVVCLEAVEYDQRDEFHPLHFSGTSAWQRKKSLADFFSAPLFLLSHCTAEQTKFRLHEVKRTSKSQLGFATYSVFQSEGECIEWWAEIKQLPQTKRTYEARSRQDRTAFDRVIEQHDYFWGGNLDGVLLDRGRRAPLALLEIRKSKCTRVEEYDPADYFQGTINKSGDYKTWLPLIYLKKAYNLPLILITLSEQSPDAFGFTEVKTISRSQLYYQDGESPTMHVTSELSAFRLWLGERI